VFFSFLRLVLSPLHVVLSSLHVVLSPLHVVLSSLQLVLSCLQLVLSSLQIVLSSLQLVLSSLQLVLSPLHVGLSFPHLAAVVPAPCGFAAAHGGKPLAYRRLICFGFAAMPPFEAQPRIVLITQRKGVAFPPCAAAKPRLRFLSRSFSRFKSPCTVRRQSFSPSGHDGVNPQERNHTPSGELEEFVA
jgi:hypothetical protein